MSEVVIRQATYKDASLILEFIKELARYEKAEHEVIAAEADIIETLFADTSTTQALICESDGQPIGYAVYFFNYSTWLGKNGLYLEDLYITPKKRGVGAGKAMLTYLAKQAVSHNCGRFEWSCLDWNEPAIKFYESLGAKAQNEWVGYRLSGQALLDLAES
ncbi:GNAT family N-acetyltransferase [Endozoicomonas sp. SM1973]|uniref:GNAT family N-acetyltransferase n=1 Tax=Spartinivicinus marinus TaxID=2994442 RepID=A0A853IAE7_9GAMM|nr:GNAT family N-acetyltransferase [Spartinivicinus marinus]MCX4026569.1 GNAT family N-acetyltransferase [Spartinivicinus marinus]NYZ64406.1 GNAT family N-acetyltransferase [Spartinivicinus marinus]